MGTALVTSITAAIEAADMLTVFYALVPVAVSVAGPIVAVKVGFNFVFSVIKGA